MSWEPKVLISLSKANQYQDFFFSNLKLSDRKLATSRKWIFQQDNGSQKLLENSSQTTKLEHQNVHPSLHVAHEKNQKFASIGTIEEWGKKFDYVYSPIYTRRKCFGPSRYRRSCKIRNFFLFFFFLSLLAKCSC